MPAGSDLAAGLELADRDGGLHSATNDICSRSWSTENDRIVRKQQFYWSDASPTPTVVISVEGVGYQPGQAHRAVEQIDQAVSSCARWVYPGGVMSAITPGAAPAGTLPGAFAWTADDARPDVTYHFASVVQSKGDVLVAVYVRTSGESALTSLTDRAAAFVAQRLTDAG